MTLEEMRSRKKELGYSNRELAEKSGVPFSTVQKIFGGSTGSPRHRTLEALESVLQPAYHAETGRAGDNYNIPSYSGHGRMVHEEAVSYTAGGQESASGKKSPENAGPESLTAGGRNYPPVLRDNGAAYVTPGKRQGEYTVEDWENLPDDVHAELIDGVLYNMASPLIVHQEFVSMLVVEFSLFVREHHGKCRVYPAPTGCRAMLDDRTMVEPDVSVVCDRDKISRKWVNGAPDLVVEVLSPSNRKNDMIRKLRIYEESGVREYWIVDPQKKRVIVYNFDDADVMHLYTFHDKVPVGIWDNKCVIDFGQLYSQISYLYKDT